MNLIAWAEKKEADAIRNEEKKEWEAHDRTMRKREADRLSALTNQQERQAAKLAEARAREKCTCGDTLASMHNFTPL